MHCAARSSRPRKGPTRHQLQHLKRFVMEHGFANSIIQTDGENAITELAQQAAQQLGLPTRQSPTYDHRSQGSVERFHQTLFAQLRAKPGFNGHLILDWNITIYHLLLYHGFFNTAPLSSTASWSGTTARLPLQPTMDTTRQLLFSTSGRSSIQISSASTTGS